MSYQYATILEVQNDDPRNDTSEGDIFIEAGKLEDGDSYTVLGDDEIVTVEMEAVEIYELPERMSEREAQEFARDEYVDEPEAEA